MAFKTGIWDRPAILRYPFSSDTAYRHSQGWGYQEREAAFLGTPDHPAHDFAAAEGTRIYAPRGGYVFRSFQQAIYTVKGKPLRPRGKQVYYSLGRFVQIYDPELDIYLLLAHMKTTNNKVPFVRPRQTGPEYYPTVLQAKPDELIRHCQWIRQGEYLGTVGVSGLGWGYHEKPDYVPISRPSWDPVGPHLHLEVFGRRWKEGEGMVKAIRFDPYGLYTDDLEMYARFDLGEITPTPPGNMWELDRRNRPRFAA